MQKRVLAIHDLSCVGRCSLTVALPILSAAGIDTGVIPTALLSTHTGGFSGYTHLDLSNQLLPIAKHLQTLHLHFDAIYTGYLADEEQCDTVLQIIQMLKDEDTHVLVDPAFGDNGRMYGLLNEKMPQKMSELCSYANTIVPNSTEASFLLGKPFSPVITQKEAAENCLALREKGTENIIITDIRSEPGQTGVAVLSKGMKEPSFYFHRLYEGMFHGTGDVFASFLLGAFLNGKSVPDAVQTALKLTQKSLIATIENGDETRYGLCFEPVLGEFSGICAEKIV